VPREVVLREGERPASALRFWRLLGVRLSVRLRLWRSLLRSITVTRPRSCWGLSCCVARLREGVVAWLLRWVLRDLAWVLDVLRVWVCRLGADFVLAC
jgi:hypothetical protein